MIIGGGGGEGTEVLLKKLVVVGDHVGTAAVGYGVLKCKDMLQVPL